MIDTTTGEIISTASFQHSPQMNELFEALAVTQQMAVDVEKDQSGYKSRYTYANLDQIIEKNREIWTNAGLSIVHLPTPSTREGFTAMRVIIGHKSGQWFSDVFEMSNQVQEGAQMSLQQAEGAVYSYLRRYSFYGILQIAQEDNDAQDGRKQVSQQDHDKATTQTYTIRDPDASATEGQKKAIQAIAGRKDVNEEQRERLLSQLDSITKGKASEIISYYKNKDAESKKELKNQADNMGIGAPELDEDFQGAGDLKSDELPF